ncbi:hypothetical protein BDV59DRAFT_204250 [Aspergillus ambiguus]|uniref:uncharacterized protein n=1 Tax=Aspergillus ambiguus TaxID=176160 RepID=UPI003CCD1C57
MLFRLFLLLLLSALVPANVEKTIFLAPPSVILPSIDPALDDLGLQRLSPNNPVLRTKLNVSFPTGSHPGTDSWYFLENLSPGQRYEVRICWLATQPTAFTLSTFTLRDAIDDPSLLSAISVYASTRLDTKSYPIPRKPYAPVDPAPSPDSALFLRVRAAADFFSLNSTLMESPPPVVADIILDPFLANVFPRSLVPTAAYGAVVACLALVVARFVWGQFQRAVDATATQAGPAKKDQ